jgi:hypothetical protein
LWHDDAHIVGDEAALRALREAIDAAIRRGAASSSYIFTCDGEGYRVRVVRRATNDLPVPYVDPLAADNSPFPDDLKRTLNGLSNK